MATFYLDFENGNDSNNGLSFANRWKTITFGATAARTAPGDTIRIMKSPDPVSLGVNGTFTKQSQTITLASAVTANISTCETAWTALSNITTSTSTTRKEGSLSTSITPAAAFISGVMAYQATGTLNLSPYQNVSFWMRSTNSHAANTFRLDLCSDTAGTTPVHSITIDTVFGANIWKPIVWKNGAALSSSIQSVALTALSDPGTPTILLDNIIATNDLHFNSLIGTSSSATSQVWYPIRSINGTTITIGNEQNQDATGTVRGWHDTTITTTAYVRDTIRITALQSINESGTDTARITYSGGWNRTDMSTQDGLTIVSSDRQIMTSNTFVTGAIGRITTERLGVLWGPVPFSSNSLTYNRFINCSGYGCNSPWTGSGSLYFENFDWISNNSGMQFTSCIINKADIYSNSVGTTIVTTNEYCRIKDLTILNSSTAGWTNNNVVIASNVIIRDSGATCGFRNVGYCEINGITTSGNTTVAIINDGMAELNNISISEATKLNSTSSIASAGLSRYSTFKGLQYRNSIIILQDTNAVIHGSTSISYQHNVQSYITSETAITQSIQPFAVNSSTLVTFKVWVRRTSTSVAGRVRIRGYVTPGVDSDVTATITAAINTWEELSVTCTPTSAGIVMIDLESYSLDGNTGTVYFGDVTLTQS